MFPYEWFNSFEKMHETNFPEHKEFFSELAGENITQKKYDFGQSVYNRFCKSSASEQGQRLCMRDYHNLYLKTDVL